MTPERLSKATDSELAVLSNLCLRSKASWGYDTEFMAACVDVLAVKHADLAHPTAVIRTLRGFAGMVRLDLTGKDPELSKLFVCPDHMGTGVGAVLLNWAKHEASGAGHAWLLVESDPDAEAFYVRHGAVRIGKAPSEAIEGRMLPLLKIPTSIV